MNILEISHYTAIGERDSMPFSEELAHWEKITTLAPPNIIATIGQFQILMTPPIQDAGILVAAYDAKNKKYAMFLNLKHFHGGAKNCYQEKFVIANKSYRGMNLPVKIYASLIKNQNLILVSDTMQTRGAQSIWEKLDKVPGIGVFGYNTKTHNVFQLDTEDAYDTDIKNEIEYLEREGTIAAEEELKKLRIAKGETVRDIRLFAAKTK